MNDNLSELIEGGGNEKASSVSRLAIPCLALGYTKTRRAAVLVLLYEQPEGTLRVLLTTRAKTLRTHPGQTALPGGRMDDSDASIVETAVRRVP